jgi:uncharacterized protein
MTSAVTHFEIYAEEPEKLAEFYREIFGWKINKAVGVDYFHIDTGGDSAGVRGGLMERPIPGPRSWMHYVRVDSLDETIERIERLGGKVLKPRTAVPKSVWYAVVEDPQGSIFAIYQPDATAMPEPEPE